MITRLSVLNTSAGSRGINQRAHYSIDQFASSTVVPYSTIRPRDLLGHDLTGPVPHVVAGGARTALSGTRRAVTFRVALERQFLESLTRAGVPAGEAELLIAREWAILAGENDYTTDTFQRIAGRPRAPWPSSFTGTARYSSDDPAPADA